jgi:hypothetical protein
MARPPGNNTSQPSHPATTSSPTLASRLLDTMLDAQQISQGTPMIGASVSETIGTTIFVHVSTTMHAAASTVVAAAKTIANTRGKTNQGF